MKDINIQLKELQEFLDFVNERDKQLWNKYLRRYEMDTILYICKQIVNNYQK